MNVVSFFYKVGLSILGATGTSILVAVATLLLLKGVVYIFRLNYGRDVYWVFTITNFVFIVTWVLSIVYIAMILK